MGIISFVKVIICESSGKSCVSKKKTTFLLHPQWFEWRDESEYWAKLGSSVKPKCTQAENELNWLQQLVARPVVATKSHSCVGVPKAL